MNFGIFLWFGRYVSCSPEYKSRSIFWAHFHVQKIRLVHEYIRYVCMCVYRSVYIYVCMYVSIYYIIVTGFVPRFWVMTLWKIFAVDMQFKQLRKRSLKKKFRLQRDSNPWPLRYRCSALPTELWGHNCWEQVNFSGSIMPLRVIQHYSDWVCTAVLSNDVMKDLRGWYAI